MTQSINIGFTFHGGLCWQFSLWPSLASAQTVTGTLQGTVTDTKAGVVPGVDIVVTNETGQERNLTTNSDGTYTAAFLPLGAIKLRHPLRVSASTKEDIEMTLNETRVVDFVLNPRGVTEAVLITSEAAQINTSNAEIKGSLNSQEILDKPTLNQSNFSRLQKRLAAFRRTRRQDKNNPTLSSGSSINFNGTGTRGATFQINGVNNDDSPDEPKSPGASLATIREFQGYHQQLHC